jgi:hypothetical protein
MLGFAAAGLLVSAYLTYLSFTPPTSCPISSYGIFSCDEVIWSKYSHFYGVSVALLGLSWFIIVLLLLVLTWRDERFMQAVVAWSLLGAAGVRLSSTQSYSCSDLSVCFALSRTSQAWRYSRSRYFLCGRLEKPINCKIHRTLALQLPN